MRQPSLSRTSAVARGPYLPPSRTRPTGRQAMARCGGAALVLAGGWRLQYRTLRCAARCFDRVYVLGTKEARTLAHSTACLGFRELEPDAPVFGEASIPLINALCSRWKIDCILPSDAETTLFLAQHRLALDAACFPVPDEATFTLLNNKHTFTDLCQSLGVPTPRTRLVADKQQLLDLLAAGQLAFPLVAKPLDMWGSFGVHVLESEAALPVAESIQYKPILVQEYIDGADLCAFYYCSGGEALAEVVYRPEADALHYLEHRGIREACTKIIRHVGYDGVIGFDVREGSKGLAFLECNPRFWYNMDLTMLGGMNFIRIGLQPGRTTAPLEAGLAGRAITRPPHLLRKLPRSWNDVRQQSSLLRYYLADLPMGVRMALHKVLRDFGIAGHTARDASGHTTRLA